MCVSLGPAVRVALLVAAQEAEAVERARIESELSVARTIQQELLPRELPSPAGWRFEAHYEPSRQVGGDYYDVLTLGDGRYGLLVADVSGKGVPAALVMATCRSVFRSVAMTLTTPAEVMRAVNASLYEDVPGATFVTCFYDSGSGVLEPGGMLLLYSDGVIEAMSKEGTMFGMDSLLGFVRASDPSGSFAPDLMTRLRHHCAPSTDLGDDVTLLSIRRSS
jgi:serine phosphatase RsbU (regulator of sigma subunit)